MPNEFTFTRRYILKEFACKCCGKVVINNDLLYMLYRLMYALDDWLQITSGYRCPKHNKEVGGAKRSYHLKGMAVDLYSDKYETWFLAGFARTIGFTGVIEYPDRGFVHLDVRYGVPYYKMSKQASLFYRYLSRKFQQGLKKKN